MHTLNLTWCAGVVDVSMLGGVHTLLLCSTSVRDVNTLSEVQYLDLSGCRFVEDVSALGQVDTLDLRNCFGVKDISALTGVRRLIRERRDFVATANDERSNSHGVERQTSDVKPDVSDAITISSKTKCVVQ